MKCTSWNFTENYDNSINLHLGGVNVDTFREIMDVVEIDDISCTIEYPPIGLEIDEDGREMLCRAEPETKLEDWQFKR